MFFATLLAVIFSDVVMGSGGREDPRKALEKHCIFVRSIKCVYDVYYNMCCAHVFVVSLPTDGDTLTSPQTRGRRFTSKHISPSVCD